MTMVSRRSVLPAVVVTMLVTTLLSAPLASAGSASVRPAGTPRSGGGVFTSRAVPLDSFGSMAVSTADGGHVFVRPQLNDEHQDVVALDADGSDPVPLAGTDDAAGIALSADQTTLFVTLPTHHEIMAVDTRTLTETPYVLGTDVRPGTEVVTDGRVWFCAEDDADESDDCLLMSWTSNGGVTASGLTFGEYTTLTSGGPAAPGVLYVRDEDFHRLALTPTGTATVTDAADDEHDLVVPGPVLADPTGRVLFELGFGSSEVLSASTLTKVDSLPSPGDETTAVAARSDGAVAVGSDSTYPGGVDANADNVNVYAAGQTQPASTYRLGFGNGYASEIPSGGLAFGDGPLYAAVFEDGGGSGPHLALDVVAHPLTDGPVVADVGPGTQLPMTHFHQVLPDSAVGRVFYDGGEESNGVVVTDLEGRHARVLQHLAGPGDMTLSPDGRWLYVPLEGADAIARIDARTLQMSLLPTGVGSSPTASAMVGGLLLTVIDVLEKNGQTSALVALDPTTGRIQPLVAEFCGDGLLGDPRHPDRFYVGNCEEPGPPVFAYRLTQDASHHVTSVRALAASNGPGGAVTVTPDGLHLLSGASVQDGGTYVEGGPDVGFEHQAELGVDQDDVAALAVRSDGLVAAMSGDSPRTDIGPLELFRSVGGPYLTSTLKGDQDHEVVGDNGLAFGTRDLYVVVEHYDAEAQSLRVQVLPMPTVAPVSLDTDRLAYQAGDVAHVLVHTAASGVHATGRVCVYLLRSGHRRQLACRRSASGATHSLSVRVRSGDTLVAVLSRGRARHRVAHAIRVTKAPVYLEVDRYETVLEAEDQAY